MSVIFTCLRFRTTACTKDIVLRLQLLLIIYIYGLIRAEKSKIVDRVNENVIVAMTEDVFQYAARGFYDIDKLMFGLLLALTVEMKAGKVTQEEFTAFITGKKWLSENDFSFVRPTQDERIREHKALQQILSFFREYLFLNDKNAFDRFWFRDTVRPLGSC